MSMLKFLIGPAVGAAFLAVGWSAKAEDAVAMKSHRALSFDVGSKHALTYFEKVDGACSVMLLMSDRITEDSAIPTSAASRVTFSVLPSKTARVDTAEGKSLQFICVAGGDAMMVRSLEQVAWTPPTTR